MVTSLVVSWWPRRRFISSSTTIERIHCGSNISRRESQTIQGLQIRPERLKVACTRLTIVDPRLLQRGKWNVAQFPSGRRRPSPSFALRRVDTEGQGFYLRSRSARTSLDSHFMLFALNCSLRSSWRSPMYQDGFPSPANTRSLRGFRQLERLLLCRFAKQHPSFRRGPWSR